MDYTITYVMLGAASVCALLWVILFFRYSWKFKDILAAVDPKQYLLTELFFIGFGFIDMFKINLRTESGRKKQKKIAEVYGEKYAAFHHYCIVGGQFTYALTLAPLGLSFGAIIDNTTIGLLALVATAVLVVYLDMDINDAVENKRDEILSDYPEMLSKLTLLVNAGLVVREAIGKVAYTSDRPLYKELQTMSEEIHNGVPDMDALFNLSQRCGVSEIRKFASIVSQNIQKGGSELLLNLRFMNTESWEEKKHRAKRKGETAASKLTVPMMIMFVGILLMIIIPVFTGMF